MVSLAKTFSGSMTIDLGMLLDVLDLFLDNPQETGAGRSVDHLVVAGERKLEEIFELDAAGGTHGPQLDRADPQDGDLWRVQQRREGLDPQAAEIADREGRTAQIVGSDVALIRLRRKLLAG